MPSVRRLFAICALGLSLGAGAVLALQLARRPHQPPAAPAVIVKIREVARLEALDVSVYKKISFAPDPTSAGSFWGDVAGWLRHTLASPHGKAIVFADAHLVLDLDKLGPESLRVQGSEVWLTLPPVQVRVELKPGETEIIGSNLDSAETARLFELARAAFERELAADARLRERARASAERAIRGLLLGLGFREVHFVERLPAGVTGS
jgi:Protein of unknown function (DUF4230)